MAQIKVRIVRAKRDGFILKWKVDGVDRQRRCHGRTQRARETERAKLEQKLNHESEETTWAELWDLFRLDHLSQRSDSHAGKCKMMHRRLARVVDPKERVGKGEIPGKRIRCATIDRKAILRVQADMKRSDVEPSTIKSNMATLWAMISWGQDEELIPEFRRPRKRKGKQEKQLTGKSKGRPLSGEEIDRLIDAIPHCIKDYERDVEFVNAVHVMRLIGMRLTECWLFSWEPMEGTHYPVMLDSDSAAIEFSNVQKSGVSSTVPLSPAAADWLRDLYSRRQGATWVCRTVGAKGEHQTPNRLGRVISAAGKRAGIVVKRFRKKDGEKIKFASAHDLRRTFATNAFTDRLRRLEAIEGTQKLTRHADVQTLVEHYLDAPTPQLIHNLSGGFRGGDASS